MLTMASHPLSWGGGGVELISSDLAGSVASEMTVTRAGSKGTNWERDRDRYRCGQVIEDHVIVVSGDWGPHYM